jgi:membrane-associated phospholipid phosphatase
VRGDASSIRAPRLANTTVPSWAAGVAALLTVQLPIGVGLYDGFSNGDWRETFEIIAGAGQSVSFSLFTSESLKRAFGRLRPDFLGRVAAYERACAKDPDGEACSEAETTAFLDGQISFPSGHTAIAFSAAGYSALALGGRFIWGARGSEVSAPLAGLTNLAILGAATWIGVSRLEDHHHHATDVVAGMGIGLFWSNIAYWTRFDLGGRVRTESPVQLGPGPGTAGLSLSGLL